MQKTIVDPTLPDYSDSILNLSCSILEHFGVKAKHETLKEADEVLSRNFKHVVVILLDGLGMNILEKNLTQFDFFRRNLLKEYSSVFPPTTTSSTTSFLSGLSPIEHGWLGWDVYFKQEDKTVTCFKNTLQNTDTLAADYHIANKYFPYESIAEQINNAGKATAKIIFPFGPEGYPKLDDWIKAIKDSCQSEKQTFTYAYWENPDGELHLKGTNSNDVRDTVIDLNARLSKLCETTKDTVFFITADHGHIDIANETLVEQHSELANMLIRETSIEPRAISFDVKPEYMEEFPKLFDKEFGQDYVLYTRKEALEMNLFGPGFPHENLTGIGDYIAGAVGSRTLLWNDKCHKYRSHHAGLSREEMRIPLIWYENKPKKTFWYVYYGIVALIIIFIGICLF